MKILNIPLFWILHKIKYYLQYFTNDFYNNIQFSFSLFPKMFAPCFILCQDLFFSRVEDMGFLHIEGYISLLVLFNAYYKFLRKGCVVGVLHRWLDQEFLDIFFGNHLLCSNLFLYLFIIVFKFLEEGIRNWVFIFEIDLGPPNLSLDFIYIFLI